MAEPLTLVDLNSDCLLKILEYCDLETLLSFIDVCRSLRSIIKEEMFPKFKKLHCSFYMDMDLGWQKKCISNIGPYLHKLVISIKFNLGESELNSRILKSFFKYIVSRIGENIRDITILAPVLPDDFVVVFRPLFARIESLKINCADNMDFNYNIDCRSMCPNLLHLHMQGDMTFVPNAEPWPKLESLVLGDNEFVWDATIKRFLVNNPQVKRLKVSTFNADLLVEDVVASLPNLEQWTIFQNNSNLLASNASLLHQLARLNVLKILRIGEEQFNGIVKGLEKCAELRYLKIQAEHEDYEERLFEPNLQNIYKAVADLQKLEIFEISHCKLNENFVIDFVKLAPATLKELHWHTCEVKITESLIRRVAQVVPLRKNGEDAVALKLCAETESEVDMSAVSIVTGC